MRGLLAAWVSAVCMLSVLAGGRTLAFNERQSEFDKSIRSLEESSRKDPTNPQTWNDIAIFYWEELRRNSKLSDSKENDYILKGLEASDKAITLQPNYAEAIVFKALLLRMQALREKDKGKQKSLIDEANRLSDKGNLLRAKRQAWTPPL